LIPDFVFARKSLKLIFPDAMPEFVEAEAKLPANRFDDPLLLMAGITTGGSAGGGSLLTVGGQATGVVGKISPAPFVLKVGGLTRSSRVLPRFIPYCPFPEY
jgi:hypothetical protein